MLIINPTISTDFQAQKNSKTIKKDSKLSKETGQEAKLCLVLGCLATIAAATIGIKKGRVVSFAEALEKNGVEIKNQIAYIKGTDKKFTGSVSRITKSLAREKETTRFIDGIIHEEIVYNRSGQELRGKFYKDGKLYRTGVVTDVYPGRGSKKTKEKFVIYEEYGFSMFGQKMDILSQELFLKEAYYLSRCAVSFLKARDSLYKELEYESKSNNRIFRPIR